jgi:predicted metal-dependent peptidase
MHPQLQRCYDLAIKGAWAHPFFLIPLGHCEWNEATPELTKTMACASVVKQGKPEVNLYINTEWAKSIPDEQIFGVLAHEILHSMLRHHERGGGKNADIWNQAADMAINASLIQAEIKLPPTALLPPKDHWEDAAEELYTLLDTGEIQKPKGYDPDKVTQGCMPQQKSDGSEPGSQKAAGDDSEGQGDGSADGEGDGQGQGNGSGGQPDGQDGEGQGQGQGKSSGSGNQDRAWGEMIAQAQSYSRGTGTAKVMARLFKPKPIKTLWARLLRKVANRAQAKGGRDTQTFNRVNRRSGGGDIIFPGWQATSPAITVIIDSSGSVSDEMLRASLSSVKEIAENTSVRIFLALHDGSCYHADWIKPETTVEYLSSLCTNRGGTDPKEAFEKVSQAKGRFDVGVYLTDGEVGVYPDKPLNVKRMIVGVVGDGKYRTETPSSWQEVLVEITESAE